MVVVYEAPMYALGEILFKPDMYRQFFTSNLDDQSFLVCIFVVCGHRRVRSSRLEPYLLVVATTTAI